MIIALITQVLIVFFINRINKQSTFIENLSSSLLFYLGLVGVISFLATELFNANYNSTLLIILAIILFINLVIFLISKKPTVPHFKLKNKTFVFQLLFITFLVIIVLRSVSMPIQGWDAFSLYDARAKFSVAGVKYFKFKEFSKFDNYNQFYYFSYPPMTSEIHAMIYSINITTPMFIYSIFYWSIVVFTFLILYRLKITKFIKILLFLVIALNFSMLSQIDSSYSNLPMTAFEIAAIYYLLKYIKVKNTVSLILSSSFLAFSVWTRSLELTFIGYLIAVVYIVLLNKNENKVKKTILIVTYFLLSIILKIVWSLYIRQTVGSLPGTTIDIISIIPKLFDSMTIANILNVAIFIINALLDYKSYMLIFILAIVLQTLLKNKNRLLEANTLLIILTTNLSIMFLGTLYFSQTFSWWSQIPGSFERSNLIIIPITVLYVAYVLEGAISKVNNV